MCIRDRRIFVAAVDLDVIVRQQQAPAGLVGDAAVAGALAFLAAGGAQRVAGHRQALDVGMLRQHPDGCLLYTSRCV